MNLFLFNCNCRALFSLLLTKVIPLSFCSVFSAIHFKRIPLSPKHIILKTPSWSSIWTIKYYSKKVCNDFPKSISSTLSQLSKDSDESPWRNVLAILISVHGMLIDSEWLQIIACVVNLNHWSLGPYCTWEKTYGIIFGLYLYQYNYINNILGFISCGNLSVDNSMHILK